MLSNIQHWNQEGFWEITIFTGRRKEQWGQEPTASVLTVRSATSQISYHSLVAEYQSQSSYIQKHITDASA